MFKLIIFWPPGAQHFEDLNIKIQMASYLDSTSCSASKQTKAALNRANYATSVDDDATEPNRSETFNNFLGSLRGEAPPPSSRSNNSLSTSMDNLKAVQIPTTTLLSNTNNKLNDAFLKNRPSAEKIYQRNVIPHPNWNKHSSAKASLEKAKRQELLANRLAQRPERWDLHKREILLTSYSPPSTRKTSPTTTMASHHHNVHNTTSRETHTNHDVQSAILSRGGISNAEASSSINFAMSLRGGDDRNQVDHHTTIVDEHHVRRRLNSHLQTRPKYEKLVEVS